MSPIYLRDLSQHSTARIAHVRTAGAARKKTFYDNHNRSTSITWLELQALSNQLRLLVIQLQLVAFITQFSI